VLILKIKIISIPDGGAPFWVRQAWIGIELEAEPDTEAPVLGIKMVSVEGPVVVVDKINGYVVKVGYALEMLKSYNEKAYEWREGHFSYEENSEWIFNQECCKPLS